MGRGGTTQEDVVAIEGSGICFLGVYLRSEAKKYLRLLMDHVT